MKRLLGFATAATLVGVLVAAFGAGPGGQLTAHAQSSDLVLTLDIGKATATTGDTLTFTSEITNNGAAATPALIANLTFASIDLDTYVDPEDWSPQRTIAIAPIGPGQSATQSWTVTPVLPGEIAIYVAVLPGEPELVSNGSIAASPGLRLSVDEHRSLNPGGVLPVVVAVPAFVAAAFVGLVAARRRI